MTKKSTKRIIRAKAEFLINMSLGSGVEINSSLEKISAAIKEVDALPDRGKKQRLLVQSRYVEVAEMRTQLKQEIGESVLRTFQFIMDNRDLLTRRQRTMLLKKEKKSEKTEQ